MNYIPAKLNIDLLRKPQPTKILDQKAEARKSTSKASISDIRKGTGLWSASPKLYPCYLKGGLESKEALKMTKSRPENSTAEPKRGEHRKSIRSQATQNRNPRGRKSLPILSYCSEGQLTGYTVQVISKANTHSYGVGNYRRFCPHANVQAMECKTHIRQHTLSTRSYTRRLRDEGHGTMD